MQYREKLRRDAAKNGGGGGGGGDGGTGGTDGGGEPPAKKPKQIKSYGEFHKTFRFGLIGIIKEL